MAAIPTIKLFFFKTKFLDSNIVLVICLNFNMLPSGGTSIKIFMNLDPGDPDLGTQHMLDAWIGAAMAGDGYVILDCIPELAFGALS